MNNTFNLSKIFLLVIVIFLSCKKDIGNAESDKKPVPTAHGTAEGAATNKTIGPLGGTIQTPDGNITIEIPAGAVTSETSFTIQPVTSTLPSATGIAYRLGPENVNFQKDVRIRFKYTDNNLEGTTENDLYMAYQDAAGYWRRVILTEIDKAGKTLTASTKHFSDWTMERIFHLTLKGENSLSANEKTKLEAVYSDVNEIDSTIHDNLIAPLESVPVKNIDGWFVNGAGSIDNPKANGIVYTAPASIPAPVKIAVGVNIKNMVQKRHPNRPGNAGLVILLGPLDLVPEEYFTWEFNGSSNTALALDGVSLGSNTNIIGTGLTGGVSLTLNETKPGSYDLGNVAIPGKFNLQVSVSNQSSVVYQGTYYKCNESIPRYGAGKLNITKYGSIGGMIEGSFTATVYNPGDGCQPSSKQVTGSFKVKRKA